MSENIHQTVKEHTHSQQRHFLQAPKDVFVCSVLIYVQRIRGFTTMHHINLRFTYLLTYLLTYLHTDTHTDTQTHSSELTVAQRTAQYNTGKYINIAKNTTKNMYRMNHFWSSGCCVRYALPPFRLMLMLNSSVSESSLSGTSR